MRNSVVGNFSWNIVGGVVSLVLALVAVPIVVHRLGTDEYGLYALVAVFLGHFQFLDFGMSRAVERFGAMSLGEDERASFETYVSVAWVFQLGIAALAAFVVIGLGRLVVPLIIESSDGRATFTHALPYIGLTLAFSLAAGVPAGVLRALQRFDLVNKAAVASSAFMYAALIGAVLVRPTFEFAVLAGCASGGFALLIWVVLAWRVTGFHPSVASLVRRRSAFAELFRFGGYLSLTDLLAPVLSNFEKLVLSRFVGASALTYYMVPFRAIQRISLVPSALSRALFPRLSELVGGAGEGHVWRAAVRATEVLLWLLLPMFAVILIGGDELLGLWMGGDFAAQAAGFLPWLACGWLINMLAWNTIAALHAFGRTDVHAYLYAVEVVLFVPAVFLAVSRFGLKGAAVAWFGRVTFDAVGLWLMVWRIARRAATPEALAMGPRMRVSVGAAFVAVVASLAAGMVLSGGRALAAAAAMALLLGGVTWRLVPTDEERARIRAAAFEGLRRVRGALPGAGET